MGCECDNHSKDLDLDTSKIPPNELQIASLSLPEEEKIDSSSFPYELSHLIKSKLNTTSQTPIKFMPITEEEFNSIQERNTYAPEIIKNYASQLDEIEYENDIQYKDIPPIKVIDPNGGSQYYHGGFNRKVNVTVKVFGSKIMIYTLAISETINSSAKGYIYQSTVNIILESGKIVCMMGWVI